MKNPLLFGILYVIVALLIVVSGVAFWQKERTMPQVQPLPPSPSGAHFESTPFDPTANWKTYHNDKYGFAFDYPNSYQVGQGREIKTLYGQEKIVGLVAPSRSGDYFPSVTVHAGLSLKELKDGEAEIFNDKDNFIESYLHEDKKMVGGVEATEFIVFWRTKNTGGVSRYLFLQHPSRKNIVFTIQYGDEDFTGKFLSSFKFFP